MIDKCKEMEKSGKSHALIPFFFFVLWYIPLNRWILTHFCVSYRNQIKIRQIITMKIFMGNITLATSDKRLHFSGSSKSTNQSFFL